MLWERQTQLEHLQLTLTNVGVGISISILKGMNKLDAE